MRIGISSFWFNRGQAVVARQLRSALESLGHDTRVLARPTRGGNIRPAFIDREDVWDQPGIDEASHYKIPADELERWAREREIEVAFFDQNYQFEEIGLLREIGVKTIGRFVWEQFAPEHVEAAKRAFDVIYSMTSCEQERYAGFGIDSPRVQWGIHPELLAAAERAEHNEGEHITYFFPGGFMSRRKPIERTLQAFKATTDQRLKLVVKSQVERGSKAVQKAARKDERIELVAEDLPTDAHLNLFASADVCLAPSRWEGLGLHLYEAMALGLPIITNDNPPMNEVVEHEVNGLLVKGIPSPELTPSGIPAFDPDAFELAEAIERIADGSLRADLADGAAQTRDRLSWSRTKDDLAALLANHT
jgi:glycosyltransferase involved in cell wall biosynthesis